MSKKRRKKQRKSPTRRIEDAIWAARDVWEEVQARKWPVSLQNRIATIVDKMEDLIYEIDLRERG